MIKFFSGFVFLCLFCIACNAQDSKKTVVKDEPYIKIADKVQAKPGRLVKLSVQTNGKVVKWFSASDENDLVVSDSGLWAIFCATIPGDYRVFVYTSMNDIPTDPQLCLVTVAGQQPAPVPPTPVDPVSAFESKLKSIIDKNQESKKIDCVKLLSSVYGKLSLASQDESYKTIKDLYEYGIKLSLASLTPDDIQDVRDFIGSYLNALAPTSTEKVINKNDRDLFYREFKMISETLAKLAK